MKSEYAAKGYFVVKGLFSKDELQKLRSVVLAFHASWQQKNASFYAENAVNSAYLTGREHLDEAGRKQLFRFIGSSRLMDIANSFMNRPPAFMNTQLFFDPVNKLQKNYWHRDPQYHLSVEQQQAALAGPDVAHFRVPLVDEPGIELIPGSHKRWDTNEELEVRLEHNGRKNYHDLSGGVKVALAAGDLLVFSANMIHRGLYGQDRLSLDILLCEPEPGLVKFADDACLPSREIIKTLEHSAAFESTIHLKAIAK
ncbi:phytanoyl-CoA dioxygenase family protein [Thalassomonas actiniarum]|uniref:Phytanoyl-CoA dioxygenase family protein n=1 Tax=Thalassomonas actiniarum TaxID=485447 RepID=A0AAE9YRX9_9GAMM|nr:phytanoyl-CoA dioxygenase family protein [Thalassomonas actiniarum]WDD99960.1 phytanoyl-CoA dioxygenase family protein [Thalassomonas actiniarum]